jgi:hypothetical protein
MTREDFMAFFRRDDFHELISVEDAREVFATVLHGASDVAEMIPLVMEDYGLTWDDI